MRLRTCIPLLIAIAALNGCAVAHLAQEVSYKSDVDKLNAQITILRQQCKDDMRTTELDPIRQKVELFRVMADKDPPAFVIASNNSLPTDDERPVISRWASMRDACVKRLDDVREVPTSANPQEKIEFQQQMAIGRQAVSHVGELVLLLYQGKLSYGDFASKQYEFDRDGMSAELAFTQAIIDRDDDRREQSRQQFTDVIKTWDAYIETVRASN